MLGIYAFKVSSPVPAVATHPDLLLIQLTKAEMDAQAGPSSFLTSTFVCSFQFSTIFTHMIPLRCFMDSPPALSTDTIDENETNVNLYENSTFCCFICMARIIDKMPETTHLFFVARPSNISYNIYFHYIMVANVMLYH